MTAPISATRLGPGALVWAGFDGEAVPGPLLDAIAAGKVGGLLVFAFRGNLRAKEQVREMLAEAQAAARRGGLPPVPVGIDQEGGAVVRIAYRAVFPSAMAIAATGDPANAERVAREVALGLRADGIAVNHMPVCDVNVEPRNPVIGTRSFGDDPESVAAFAAAWVRGSERAGVATTPKHFPGHGASRFDTHHTTGDVDADRATLEARELVPFRAAIAAGASGLMTAHVRYPALDPDAIATLSPAIATRLARETLGFRGLLVSDALDMSGVTQADQPDRLEARAISAGVDAAMVTTGLELQLTAADRIRDQVPLPRVLEAMRRAAPFRERFGVDVGEDVHDAPARALASQIATASITAPRGIPRSMRWRVAYLPPTRVSPVEELRDPAGTLEAALRRRFGDRLAFGIDRVPDGDGPLMVCTSSAVFEWGQAERARELMKREDAVLLCALRSPYDAALAGRLPFALTYGDVPVSLEALAAAIDGERTAPGRAPVRLA